MHRSHETPPPFSSAGGLVSGLFEHKIGPMKAISRAAPRIMALARFMAIVLAVSTAIPSAASAKGMSLIRDAEIENTIRDFATPIFKAAGLNPDDVDIYLVQDDSLNAFVAGGQNIFINTGLITKTESASELIGVLAHETGHIQGGHLVTTRDAHEKSRLKGLIGAVIGVAAAIGSGRADVGAAVVAGGQEIGIRSFLQYSRAQESSADQAALRLLEETKQSSEGTLVFLEKMGGQELLNAARQDPYLQTHPLTRERISAVRAHVKRSPYTNTPIPAPIEEKHRRMVAKLNGFIDNPSRTLYTYKESDQSTVALYARTIALYRKPRIKEALAGIEALLSREPDNPYFHELKGQILFENGRGTEAIAPYRKSVSLLGSSSLLRLGLARALIETNDNKNLDEAITHLTFALKKEPQSAFAWNQLAIAEGRKGDMAPSFLALAEEARIRRNIPKAKYYAERAEKMFPRGSAGWIRARDILASAALADDKNKPKTKR